MFWGFHLAAVAGVILCGFSWRGVALAVATYFVRMLLVTGGYHRYFSHRAFKTSRAFQFLLALGAQTALQKGVLWWAANHRLHHKHSDTPQDLHSAKQRGFLVGARRLDHCRGLRRDDPRARRRPGASIPSCGSSTAPASDAPGRHAGAGAARRGRPAGLVWGFLVSTVLLWHGSFAINSLSPRVRAAPLRDRRRLAQQLAAGAITTGEGWHNNHHHYQSSANQGFHWWEIDVTYYVLRLLARCGLIWDLRRPPAEVLHAPGDAPPDALPDAA